jgi:branched-chain amino acid transport system substrate-binding protein
MIGTFSGILADGGQAGHDAILAWEHWVDSHGGINGHQVIVYPEDDNADGATALSDAKDLVENKHVVAFVGSMQYSTMSAIEPYLRQKHIPVVGGDQSTPVWWSSPVLFPLGYGPNIGAWAEGKIAVDLHKPNIGILYCAESDACTLNEQQVANNPGVEQAGARIVYTDQISIAQPDYTAECLRAQQKNVGLLLVFADTNSVRRVSDSCARQGYHPTLGSGNADDSAGQDPNMEGYEQLTPVFSWTQDGTGSQQEYAQVVRTYNLSKNLFTTVVFSSGKMFERVVAGIQGPVTTNAIFQSLWSIRNETLDGLLPGPISYRANQPQVGGSCVIEQVLHGGHFVVGNGGQPLCR